MKFSYFPLGLLLTVAACGNFWKEPKSVRPGVVSNDDGPRPNEVTPEQQHYSVILTTLSSANLGEISGVVRITINQTDVSSTIKLTEVPQNLMVGQRSISNLSCTEIAATYPPPVVMTTMGEFKEVNEVDSSSREALVADLNRADPSNGDSVILSGKSYIVKAYVENSNLPGPESRALIPIACGTIFEE